MAYTENEIYYPYDYDASADVPEDMKTMAESIDEVIGEIKGTQTTQNTRLSALETGQTSQSAIIQSLQAENTRLKKNQIYGTATGTEVEITDSAEMEASIGVSGESEQETRSGKNKANIDEYYYDTMNYSDLNVSLNNGEFSIATNSLKIITEFIKIPLIGLKNDTTYTFGIDLKAGKENSAAQALIYDNTNKSITGEIFRNANISYVSKTQRLKTNDTMDLNNLMILLYCADNGTVGNSYSSAYKNIFFNEGTDTTYEQYGAMPSPEFPSEIKNLTGDTVCKVRGKNLWNNELEISEYDANGNKAATSVWVVSQTPINVKPNMQYTVSQAETPSQYNIICFKDDNYLDRIYNTQNTTVGYKYYTFTTPANCNKIFIQFRSTLENIAKGTYDMSTTSITKIQLEKGTKTDYEPYQEKTITFPFGEQKLAKDDYLVSDGIHHVRRQDVINISSIISLSNGNVGAVIDTSQKIRSYGNKSLITNATFANKSSEKYLQDGTFYENLVNLVLVGNADDTLETIKAKYDGGIIEYELAEPTVTPYTQAQQTAYDNLQNLILYEGYNYIEMISPNGVKANLTVDYTKSTQMVINDIEERLSVLEYAGLEG